MPVNDTTANKAYPKPNIANTLADDVGRLRTALDEIDADIAACSVAGQAVTVPAGSATAPSVSFTGDANTGVFSPGGNQVALTTDGTARLHIGSTGYIGVGSAPNDAANVLVYDAAAPIVQFANSDTGATVSDGTLVYQSGNNFEIFNQEAGSVVLSTNGTGRLFVDASGNVGVGHSPAAKLSVLGTIRAQTGSTGSIGYEIYNGTRNTGISSDFANSLTFIDHNQILVFRDSQNAYAERLRITSAGLVGIGTSSPGAPLDVVGQSDATFTNNPTVLALNDTRSFAAGVGGGIKFSGKFNSSGDYAALGFISGIKENATDGNYAGALVLGTRPNASGGGSMERLRITSTGNVGIGSTTAGAKLDIVESFATSALLVRHSGATGGGAAINVTNGVTSTTPIYSFYYNGTTGIGNPAANVISAIIDGSERARIDSSGRLLVGTSSARGSQIFQIEGSGYEQSSARFTRYGDNAVSPGILFAKTRGTTAGSNTLVANGDRLGRVEFQGTDGTGVITAALIDCFVDGTPGTNDMPGRLVFSTTADGAAAPTERMRISNVGTTTLTSAASTAPFIANIGASEVARIDSSGRLLVGTSSAYAVASGFSGVTQQIIGNDAASFLRFSADASHETLWLCKSRNATAGQHTVLQSDDGIARFNFQGSDGTNFVTAARIDAAIDGTPGSTVMPGRLVFSTTSTTPGASPTERMRIDNAGNVLISGTSTDPGFDGTSTAIALRHDGRISARGPDNFSTMTLSRGGTDGTLVDFVKTTTAVGSISVTTTATAFNTSSDYRLKENVTAVTDGITRLQQLKPSRFNFIADPAKTVDGFIAHEVQTVVPEAISGEKDAVDADGKPIYQGIDQSKLVPLLTAALQEAIGEIESLKARVVALESA